MEDADLCFERSDVYATITTKVISIKNPLSGRIYLPDVSHIIRDKPIYKGEIILTGDKK